MAKKANIGASIGLDGEKEFRAAVSGINSDMKVLASEMKKVTSEFADNATGSDALTAKNEVLNKQLETQKDKVDALRKALENAKEQYPDNKEKINAWQSSLNNAEADLAKLNNEIKENKSKMEQAQNPTKEMADDVKKFGNSAEDAGQKSLKMGDIIKANLISSAIIGGVKSLAGAMAGLISTGVKYNASIEQYTTSFETMTGSTEKGIEVTQRLKEMGAATPFELTDLAETTKLLMNYGFTADDAISRMSMLGDISQGNADKMNSVATAYGQMSSAGKVSLEDVKQMIEAGFNPLQEISSSTGESMGSLYDRISKGTISVDEITASMQRSTSQGGKYFESMEKQSKTLSGQVSTLKDNFSSFTGVLAGDATSAISQTFLPALNTMIGDMQKGFQEGGMSGLAESFGKGLSNLVNEAVKQLPSMVESAKSMIGAFADGIMQNMPTIISTGMQIVLDLVQGILQALPSILQSGLDIIVQLANGIAQNLPTLIPTAINIILQLVDTLINNIDKIVDAGIGLVMGLVDGIIAALPSLLEKAPELIEKLVTAMSNNMPKIIDAGIEIIVKLIEGIITNLPAIYQACYKIMGSLVKALIIEMTQLYTIGPKLFGKLNEAFSEINWGELGSNILKGIISGIVDAAGSIWSGIKNAGGSIVDAFETFFGIHSPSTLMRDRIGKNLALGLGEGFVGTMSGLTDKMINSVPTNFNVNGSYNLSGNSSSSANLSQTYHLPISIYVDNKLNSAQTISFTSEDLANSQRQNGLFSRVVMA